MTETSRIEQLLLKDRLILSVAMVGIFMIAAIYTFFGVGMPMSVFEMTWGEMMPMNMSEDMGKSATMSSDSGMSGQGIGEMMMSPVWSLRYAILVFLMWWIMMEEPNRLLVKVMSMGDMIPRNTQSHCNAVASRLKKAQAAK